MTDQNTIAQTLDRLVTAAERIGNAAAEHAPQALETVGAFLQMRAIIDLSIAGFFFVFTPIVAYKGIKKILNWWGSDEDKDFPAIPSLVVVSVCCAVIWGGAFFTVIDTNRIISATSPQNALMVAAAQRIEGNRR